MNYNKFLEIVKPYTMTSVERIKTLYDSLEYIRFNNLDGDIVECGVWKGGNILGCIEYCKYHNMDKKFWLYDTFSGMTKPSQFDVDLNGINGMIWEGKCDSSIEMVKKIIDKSNYKSEKIKFIDGDICTTLDDENNIPSEISILRLDTDWYDSTKKEMDKLYPRLVIKGVLIVDDYGHWMGSKKAVDEYFGEKNMDVERVDYTCIKIIKS